MLKHGIFNYIDRLRNSTDRPRFGDTPHEKYRSARFIPRRSRKNISDAPLGKSSMLSRAAETGRAQAQL